MKEKFKIKVNDKDTGRVVRYLKIFDTDNREYDLYTNYIDDEGKEIYTNDLVEYDCGDGIKRIGRVSAALHDMDFMAVDEKSGYPLEFMKYIKKVN